MLYKEGGQTLKEGSRYLLVLLFSLEELLELASVLSHLGLYLRGYITSGVNTLHYVTYWDCHD